ncbi:hypothetical protein, partial [Micromonospora sp. LOL_024]|uniref:hypothetical protein n=1 Tax=Micromonospora sp. LOL_024 TaxID=3345412 RepID=UPI003A868EBD
STSPTSNTDTYRILAEITSMLGLVIFLEASYAQLDELGVPHLRLKIWRPSTGTRSRHDLRLGMHRVRMRSWLSRSTAESLGLMYRQSPAD